MPNKHRNIKLRNKILLSTLGVSKKPENVKMTLKKLIEKSKIENDDDLDVNDNNAECLIEPSYNEENKTAFEIPKAKNKNTSLSKKNKKNKYFFLAHPEAKNRVDINDLSKNYVMEKEVVKMEKNNENRNNKSDKSKKTNVKKENQEYVSMWKIEECNSSDDEPVNDNDMNGKNKKKRKSKDSTNLHIRSHKEEMKFESRIEKLDDGSVVETITAVKENDTELEPTIKKKKKTNKENGVNKNEDQNKRTENLTTAESKLQSSRFRYLNEFLYTKSSQDAYDYFKSDPDAFQAYHRGFSNQITKWPLNPLNKIIESIKTLPSNLIIADFGCGEAKLAQSVNNKVHSFDFISINDIVTQCDMKNVPLNNECCDIVIFCLSLMGTNINEFLCEAHRVLKPNGTMKIAEVASRFENVNSFKKNVESIGFKCLSKTTNSNDYFYYFDFIKNSKKILNSNAMITLLPCLYKKR